jgi:hypothetical protein
MVCEFPTSPIPQRSTSPHHQIGLGAHDNSTAHRCFTEGTFSRILVIGGYHNDGRVWNVLAAELVGVLSWGIVTVTACRHGRHWGIGDYGLISSNDAFTRHFFPLSQTTIGS